MYITKLGFDQHPHLNSTGKSRDTAHLESQLGKNLGSVSAWWVTLQKIAVWGGAYNPKVKVTQTCPTLVTPWTIESMEFSRPEYWSG